MKLKLSQLNPNPFKKEINKGKLNKEIITRIKSNMKDLGLMGSLPIFKKDNKYFLVAGHHRVQALIETYNSNFEVEVTLHNYSDENVLRGMIVENLTQRADELVEVTENLNAVRKWLKLNPKNAIISNAEKQGIVFCSTGEQNTKGRWGEGRPEERGSIRNIYSWLSKNGEIMSVGKISEYLKVYDNLDRRLLKKTIKSSGGEVEEETISVREATNLARLPKQEQFIIKDLLDKTGLDKDGKSKLVTSYIHAPEKVKEKIKKEIVGLKDIDLAITQHNLKDREKNKLFVQDISKKIDGFIDRLSFSILDTNNNIKEVIKDIAVLSKYVKDMNEKQKAKLSSKLDSLNNLLSKTNELIKEVEKRV